MIDFRFGKSFLTGFAGEKSPCLRLALHTSFRLVSSLMIIQNEAYKFIWRMLRKQMKVDGEFYGYLAKMDASLLRSFIETELKSFMQIRLKLTEEV